MENTKKVLPKKNSPVNSASKERHALTTNPSSFVACQKLARLFVDIAKGRRPEATQNMLDISLAAVRLFYSAMESLVSRPNEMNVISPAEPDQWQKGANPLLEQAENAQKAAENSQETPGTLLAYRKALEPLVGIMAAIAQDAETREPVFQSALFLANTQLLLATLYKIERLLQEKLPSELQTVQGKLRARDISFLQKEVSESTHEEKVSGSDDDEEVSGSTHEEKVSGSDDDEEVSGSTHEEKVSGSNGEAERSGSHYGSNKTAQAPILKVSGKTSSSSKVNSLTTNLYYPEAKKLADERKKLITEKLNEEGLSFSYRSTLNKQIEQQDSRSSLEQSQRMTKLVRSENTAKHKYNLLERLPDLVISALMDDATLSADTLKKRIAAQTSGHQRDPQQFTLKRDTNRGEFSKTSEHHTSYSSAFYRHSLTRNISISGTEDYTNRYIDFVMKIWEMKKCWGVFQRAWSSNATPAAKKAFANSLASSSGLYGSLKLLVDEAEQLIKEKQKTAKLYHTYAKEGGPLRYLGIYKQDDWARYARLEEYKAAAVEDIPHLAMSTLIQLMDSPACSLVELIARVKSKIESSDKYAGAAFYRDPFNKIAGTLLGMVKKTEIETSQVEKYLNRYAEFLWQAWQAAQLFDPASYAPEDNAIYQLLNVDAAQREKPDAEKESSAEEEFSAEDADTDQSSSASCS